MATLADVQKQGFQDRLHRIRSGGPNTMGQVLVGPAEEIRAKDAKRALATAPLPQQRAGAGLADLLIVPMAALLGAVAVLVGRVVTFQFLTDGAPFAFTFAGMPSQLFADFMIAALLAMILALGLKLDHGLRRVAITLGFVSMMVGEPRLLEEFPDVFSIVYSDSYVSNTVAGSARTL